MPQELLTQLAFGSEIASHMFEFVFDYIPIFQDYPGALVQY